MYHPFPLVEQPWAHQNQQFANIFLLQACA